MWTKMLVTALALALPCGASAESLREAVERAGRELALAQPNVERPGRGRLWTGIALLTGGGVLAALGGAELGDDETGPDDGEDVDDSDDGEDSDGWGNKALIGGGVAAATIGGVLLITGRKSGPVLSARRGGTMVGYRVYF
jgi:hypothetical protein